MSPHDHDEEQPFHLPFPHPPPFPHSPDHLFYLRAEAQGAAGDAPARDADDILLRKVPAAVAKRFRMAAGGRGMTHAQYLAALVALHDAMRGLADAGDERLKEELERLGLATVTV